jgi:hypothetical protein
MSFLIVVLPILVVAGAFVWLRPSHREQHLAKLRSDALVEGMRIGSLIVPDTSEYGRVNEKSIIVTLYQRSLIYKEGELSSFTALRTTGESGIFLPEGWTWDGRTNISEKEHSSLSELVRSLPPSITALSLNSDSVSLSWDEKDPELSFDALKRHLSSIAQIFARDLIGQ